ncbi:MAG: hypothetical protein QNL01_08720 [Akkermansiaceae bacterium]|jgi:hypothetical protein
MRMPTIYRTTPSAGKLGVSLCLFAMMALISSASAASKTPKVLAAYLTKDKAVTGEVGAIIPPKEINKYIAKVQAAAKKDKVWHAEYAKNAKPGIPLPWHEKLGLTKEEYADYLKLWDQRQFKAVQQVVVRLEEPKAGEWMIRVSGVGMSISLLRYNPEKGTFKSPNGELKRIEDIDAEARSILGAWAGQEWRYEKNTEFINTKENIALGKFKDGKHCLLIYRLQESTSGHQLADKSLVIRFSPPKK